MATAVDAIARVLDWDSTHFGVKIAQAERSDVDRWAAENDVACVYLLIDSSDLEAIREAQSRGFFITDIRVELAMRTEILPGSVIVREAVARDLRKLVEIARASHRITRFYADPHFEPERCDALYEAWIRNSYAGWADKVLVAREQAVGYCTLHLNGTRASIGLIAVDEHARGRGIGHLLCRAAVRCAHKEGATVITTVTQGRNVNALRMFEKCGFRITNTSVWLHRHLR